MSNPLPNPCQPATVRDFAAAEFDADIADGEARYPAPHVHVWLLADMVSNSSVITFFAFCDVGDCRAMLTETQIEELLNKHAQDYGLSAVQLAAPAVLLSDRIQEYFEKRQ